MNVSDTKSKALLGSESLQHNFKEVFCNENISLMRFYGNNGKICSLHQKSQQIFVNFDNGS